MPDVVNLGQFGQPRESEIGRGLRAATEVLTQKGNIAQRERERVSREKIAEGRLSSNLASQELRKSEQDIQNVRKTHTQFSLWWNGMDAQEKSVARTSDNYKEMQKFFKGFSNLVPGLIADNGDIVPATNKNIFKEKLDENIAQAKQRLASGQMTQEDVNLIKLDSEKIDLMSSVLDEAATKLKGAEGKDPNAVMSFIKDKFNQLKGRFGRQPEAETPTQRGFERPLAEAAAPPPSVTSPQAVNPLTQGLSQQDPLGIFGR